MSDDRTVQLSAYLPLTLRVIKGALRPGTLRFLSSFRIGRSEECEVQCLDRSVSRVHADVLFEMGQWWIQDHQSRNGIFLNGQKVERAPLPSSCSLKLGVDGPVFSLEIANLLEEVSSSSRAPSSKQTALKPDSAFPSSMGSSDSPEFRPDVVVDDLDRRLAHLNEVAKEAERRVKSPNLPGGQEQDNLSIAQNSEKASGLADVKEPSSTSLPQGASSEASLKNSRPASPPLPIEPSAPLEDVDYPPPDPSRMRSKFGRKKTQESPTQIFQQILRQHKLPESDESSSDHHGPSTVVIRDALKKAFRQKSRPYLMYLGVLGAMSILFGIIAGVQYLRVESMKETAEDIFFTMKSMELELSQLESLVVDELPPDKLQAILSRREKMKAMQVQYDRFLEKIGIYSPSMSEQDRSIMRMARLFGECEIGMPPDFVDKVKEYIQRWRTTDRLLTSVQRAQRQGYGPKVAETMLTHQMPPQFFYVALQESGFDIQAVGPRTRFGIAKGPWQFIPATAVDYGLSTGPLVEVRRFDPRDERHNFEKATKAAAKYLKDIYSTEAQASGLLVMASYNWGQTRVRKLIRQLPKNPRDRNFWELLKQFKVPDETYDYVFYIFSAAVIGENPKLFGFSFQNPLSAVD